MFARTNVDLGMASLVASVEWTDSSSLFNSSVTVGS
jgi:hypothetical protein